MIALMMMTTVMMTVMMTGLVGPSRAERVFLVDMEIPIPPGSAQVALNTAGGNGAASASAPVTNHWVVNRDYAGGETLAGQIPAGCGLTGLPATAPSTPLQPAGLIPSGSTSGANGNYLHVNFIGGAAAPKNSFYVSEETQSTGNCVGESIAAEIVGDWNLTRFASCRLRFIWLMSGGVGSSGDPRHFGQVMVSADAGANWQQLGGNLMQQTTWVQASVDVPAIYLPFPLRFMFRQLMGSLAFSQGSALGFSVDEVELDCDPTISGSSTTTTTTSSSAGTASSSSSSSGGSGSGTTTTTTSGGASATSSGTSTTIVTSSSSSTTPSSASSATSATNTDAESASAQAADDLVLPLVLAIVAVVLILCVLIIVCGVVWRQRRRWGGGQADGHYGSDLPATDPVQTSPASGTPPAVSAAVVPRVRHASSMMERTHKTRDWEIDYGEIQLGKELGRGAFGVVYRGVWRATDVAVKQLDSEAADATETQAFEDEAELMRSIPAHPHVMLTLGVVLHPKLAILTEFCEGGSLSDFYEDPARAMDTALKMQFITGIAKGMWHLASQRLVHRDLACRNVLLTGTLEAKIADFGLTRVLLDDATGNRTESNVGPLRWMAPEAITDRVYSEKSDVWSFAVVVYEIWHRDRPWPELAPTQIVPKVVSRSMRVDVPGPELGAPPALTEIVSQCIAWEPEDRPSFAEIAKNLTSV